MIKRTTMLRRKYNRFQLRYLKKFFISGKIKYLLQTNNLFVADELKGVKEAYGLNQKVEKIQMSVRVRYYVLKTEKFEKHLYLEFLKEGNSLDQKINNLGDQLQTLFDSELLDIVNTRKFVRYIILFKENYEENTFDLDNEILFNPEKQISLSSRFKWDYVKFPHMLLAGNTGSGKSYLLYSLISKMRAETQTKNIFVCDGKFGELRSISSEKLGIKNVASDLDELVKFIYFVNELMEKRFWKNKTDRAPVFLVIDEFASLNLVLEKKEFKLLESKIKNIVLKGRSVNIHVLIAMQRASSDSIDLSIRDNTSVKIGLGNLSSENFRMIFGVNKNNDEILTRGVGQGYILLDGQNLRLFDSPRISFDDYII